MRLTVLQQQTKALQEERPETGAEVSKRLESLKHLLWHGNTEEPLERLGDLLMELSLIEPVRTLRRRSSTASMTLEHTSAITTSSSRTSANVDVKGKRSARHSWSRRSTKWSADDSSRNSRCSGRCAGRIFCCRPGRGSSTRIWMTYSAVGIRNSGRNHKRRSQSGRRLDPRLFGALVVNCGFGGSRLSDCVRYVSRLVLRLKPAAVVLYAGDNDLAQGALPDQAFASFRDLYGALRGYSEQMPIAFISVKPSPARIRYIDNILRFNQMVQAFLQNQPATKYIDIYTAMLGPDQKPNPALFVQDQIHLSGLGYQMLRRDVSSFLSSELHP